ncbi:unnamed protein product [Nesidiocoris tenuis]|uniref:Uncharacterized protein n=1 Tax=Nesidiocoris tenuis TaxID=355587 RepID=A0A6H5GCX1_9HEMI|nr:unnamed protein product [Nesidiocoris tenuis]CAA9999553.1 unnamed protein product [Nesidiocoris tenuis]
MAMLLFGGALRSHAPPKSMIYRYCMSCICTLMQFLLAAQYFQLMTSAAKSWRRLTLLMKSTNRRNAHFSYESIEKYLIKCITVRESLISELVRIHRFYQRQLLLVGIVLFMELVFYNHQIIVYSAERGVQFCIAYALLDAIKITTLFLISAGSEMPTVAVSYVLSS